MILDRDKVAKPPYVHQEFPALRYRGNGQFVKVNDEGEDAAAKANGFFAKPPDAGVECVPAAPGALKPKAPKPPK